MSILTELPKDRLPIKSYIVPPEKRDSAYAWLKKQIEDGDQVYIICPLVEDSEQESMKDVKAATAEFARLQSDVFPSLRLGLLHGRMKAGEKHEMMARFHAREIDILVATSVVEVGIDVPNATIIVIEAAERFGLAALHQLRGRVGRGSKQSYCLLFMSDAFSTPTPRLRYFASHAKGIDIAQFDLEERGAGDIYGTQQHGVLSMKVANLGDYVLIQQAQEAANEYLSHHTIESSKNLMNRLEKLEVERIARD
jgi:ATP-dependent DNA helicase RecG